MKPVRRHKIRKVLDADRWRKQPYRKQTTDTIGFDLYCHMKQTIVRDQCLYILDKELHEITTTNNQ